MARFSSGSAFRLRGRKSYGLRGLKGKPFHPPLTDFPVAAIVIAAVFDVIAFAGRGHAWAERWFYAAGYVFLAGVIVGLLALLTGFLDWRDTEKGTQIRRIANAHGLAMLSVAALVLVNLGIRFFAQTEDETTVALLILSLVTAAIVSAGAMIGGSMVYDYGFNVANAKDDPVYHADADANDLRRTG